MARYLLKRYKFNEDRERLNFKVSDDGVPKCHGRIQVDYPIYLPDNDPYTEKLVEYAHNATFHGEDLV